jgi:hypothetical protein
MLMWTLIRYRSQDSYRDNAFFLVMLPAFLIAKYLMLTGDNFTPATAWPSACSGWPSWSCSNAR